MQKKIPVRMCCGCKAQKPKRELIRVVKSPDGEISVDKTGKKPGRGAYLCNNKACLKRAEKIKALERAFECAIPPEVYVRLEGEMSDG